MKKRMVLFAVCAALALAGCSVPGENKETQTQESSAKPAEAEVKPDQGGDKEAKPDQGGDKEAKPDKGETKEEGGSKHVGVIFPALSNEFLAGQAEAIRTSLEALGHKVDVVSSDNDPAKELQQLENYASMGVDAVLIFPIGASANEVGTSLQKLRDQGIFISVMGNEVTHGTYDNMILVDQKAVGENTAQLAADWIDKTFPDAVDGSVEVALFVTTTSTESKTHCDAMPKIEELTKKAKIVETYDIPMSESIAKVQENTEMLLATHPDVKVILTYDASQALAANEVVMRTAGVEKDKFGIFGSDVSAEIAKNIKASTSNESVVRGTNVYGDGTVNPMVKALTGTLEVNEENIYYLEIQGITPENVDNFIE